MSLFLAYGLNPADGCWTPPVRLESAEAVYRYCAMHHHWAPEIRVCDEEDCLVLHVVDHVLKCPMPDGTLRETRL
jgi:hypothetical protein